MKKIAYPGTFDPFHNGHEHIVNSLSKMFDEVYVIVFDNTNKNTTKDIKLRSNAIKKIFENNSKVKVLFSNKTLMQTLKENDISIIGRGVRNSEDVVVEMQRANMLLTLDNIQTIFVPSNDKTTYLSSSIIRELISLESDFSAFVNKEIYNIYKKAQK